MSTTDRTLEKHFKQNMIKTNGKKKWFGTLEDLIDWFLRIKVSENLQITPSEIKDSYSRMCRKYKTFPFRFKILSNTIKFKEFIRILDELALKMNLDPEELKQRLIKLIETPEDSKFMFGLKAGFKKVAAKCNTQDAQELFTSFAKDQ